MPSPTIKSMTTEVPIRPAATVIVLRDGARGLEVLVQRRSAAMVFAPGAYAFPGGALDPEDASAPDPFRQAAVRELAEEAGLRIDVNGLKPWSRWITPPGRPRRFDTWFFIAAAPEGADITSGPEIEVDHHAWMAPEDLLALFERDEVAMLPPTVITLRELMEFATVQTALSAAERREPPFFDGSMMRPL